MILCVDYINIDDYLPDDVLAREVCARLGEPVVTNVFLLQRYELVLYEVACRAVNEDSAGCAEFDQRLKELVDG